MKIDLNSIDREEFRVKEGIIAGETCYLVNPKGNDTKWTKDNLIFRSSIWNSLGELISAGFKKFDYLGSKPEVFGTVDENDWEAREKIDGSCIIVSKYKGEIIVRTRGSFNLDDKPETKKEVFDLLKGCQFLDKYPPTANYSFLFEYVSPNQKILKQYPEPRLFYLNEIDHFHGLYVLPNNIEIFAEWSGFAALPKIVHSSVLDAVKFAKDAVNSEGICIYSRSGQNIFKVKSDWYLSLVRRQFDFDTLEKIVELYISYQCPEYDEFMRKIRVDRDEELIKGVEKDLASVCAAKLLVDEFLGGLRHFMDGIRGLTRKEAAAKVLKVFPKYSGVCFTMLDEKEIAAKQLKEIYLNFLKENRNESI